jgi:hypothetical protein
MDGVKGGVIDGRWQSSRTDIALIIIRVLKLL